MAGPFPVHAPTYFCTLRQPFYTFHLSSYVQELVEQFQRQYISYISRQVLSHTMEVDSPACVNQASMGLLETPEGGDGLEANALAVADERRISCSQASLELFSESTQRRST